MGISAALGSSALLPAGLGFRNTIINGDFRIWQRGTASVTNGYMADRWRMIHNLGSGAAATGSQQTFTAGAAPQAATEGQFFGRVQLTTAGTVRTDTFLQFVEDVRTLAAQTVTLSFWAKADASRTVDVYSGEAMGTGGSGASAEQTQAFTIGTSWQRYTWTFTTPSLSGKTIGTGSSRYIYFKLPLATCTLDVWGVQLEGNYQPTPFEQRPIGVELALCQRYYYRWATGTAYSPAGYINGVTTGLAETIVQMPVTMRVTPTALEKSGSWTGNGTGWVLGSGTFTLDSGASTQHMVSILCTSSATFTAFYAYHLIALNNSANYFALYAEL
jgi:hypothetical protein